MSITYRRRWENRRKRERRRKSETTYYGLPVIHKAHWRWSIIIYFFLGGIAAASWVLGTIGRREGDRAGAEIARAGTYISFLSFLACPICLIWDLGRPARFLNMLRVVKLRSPMSLGVWSIVIFGGLSTIVVIAQAIEDGLLSGPRWVVGTVRSMPIQSIRVINSFFALFVGGYTGVLLAATSVPLWTKRYLLMGPLFLTSAMSTGAAAITLVLSATKSYDAIERMERFERVILVTEGVLFGAFLASLGKTTSKPLRQGTLGSVFKYGVLGAGVIGPLVFRVIELLTRKRTLSIGVISSAITLVGGFLFRLVFVLGGHASADDPVATFELTSGSRDQS